MKFSLSGESIEAAFGYGTAAGDSTEKTRALLYEETEDAAIVSLKVISSQYLHVAKVTLTQTLLQWSKKVLSSGHGFGYYLSYVSQEKFLYYMGEVSL